MAAPKSARRSRKRRPRGQAPRVQSQAAAVDPLEPVPRSAREALSPRPVVVRRNQRLTAEQRARLEARQRQRDSMSGAYGERPANPFGGVPVSEIAILAGGAAAIFGLVTSAPLAIGVGVLLCTLGVVEFSWREHISGYRSHTTLLAAVPAIGLGVAMIALIGGSLSRGPLLLVVVPVFIVCFWSLRKRFRVARQARIARPPAP